MIKWWDSNYSGFVLYRRIWATPPDQQLGGTNDLIETGGSEASGFTIIELKRKLNTGDKYDKSFTKGQNINIIWGVGPSDSLDSPQPQEAAVL